MTPTTEQIEQAPPATLDIAVLRGVRPGIELRADGEGQPPRMAGHFSVFNAWYEINSIFEGRFLERVAAGAFARTFDHYRSSNDPHRISVLLEHGYDPTVGDKPLGVPDELREDDTGAFYDVPLFDTTYVRDLVPALQAGAYGASFRFRVIQDEWNDEPERSEHNPDGIPERTLTEVRVFEFGPTVFPASAAATAGLRSVSLTDRYYQQLRRNSPEQYDELLRHARDLRTSQDGPAEGTPSNEPANTHPIGSPEGTRRLTDPAELLRDLDIWEGSR